MVLVVVVFAGVTAAFGATHGAPVRFLVLDTVFGLMFVLAGFIAWERRPEVPYGAMLVLAGALWFVGSYAPTGAEPYALYGFAFERYYDIVLAAVSLTFPGVALGVKGRLALASLVAGYIFRTAGRLLVGCECMSNPLALVEDRAVFDQIQTATTALILLSAIAIASLVAVRLRDAPAVARRVLSPVLGAGVVAALVTAWDAFELIFFIRTGEGPLRFGEPWQEIVSWSVIALVALVPLAYLLGVLRLRRDRSSLASLAVELDRRTGPGEMEAALRAALRDPTVELRVWDEQRATWLDASEGEVPAPSNEESRVVTLVGTEDRPLAAIVHDRAFNEDPGLVSAVAALLRLAIDNERLAAEVREQLAEVRASRARLVETAEAERRRIERDLHDGAQQRLIAVALSLQEARGEAARDAPGTRVVSHLDDTVAELLAAIEELRELARGIHPAVLTEDGLAIAVSSLARRASIPVVVDVSVDGRLPASVEATAYYVVAEGLTNVVRHARARAAGVHIHRSNGNLEIEIEDDGTGGADVQRGSGLRGLADRLDAMSGTLSVDSPPERGTRLKATIPCA